MISLKGVSKSYKGITIFEDVNITLCQISGTSLKE